MHAYLITFSSRRTVPHHSEIVEIDFVLWMHGFVLISCGCLVLEQLCVNVRYPEFWLLLTNSWKFDLETV
jgi:hypothetical protein